MNTDCYRKLLQLVVSASESIVIHTYCLHSWTDRTDAFLNGFLDLLQKRSEEDGISVTIVADGTGQWFQLKKGGEPHLDKRYASINWVIRGHYSAFGM